MRRAHLVLAPLALRLTRTQRPAVAREALATALRASAELAGAPRALPCEAWPRTASGAPAPVLGWHASVADTSGLALALVAPVAVGVDVEWRERARLGAARSRFRESGELELLGDDGRDAVLSLWTAKEALLKLAGVGLADLGRCPLRERTGERFTLEHAGRRHDVFVREVGAHWIASASAEPLAIALHVAEAVA